MNKQRFNCQVTAQLGKGSIPCIRLHLEILIYISKYEVGVTRSGDGGN